MSKAILFTILFTLTLSRLFSQSYPYTNLVMEGGGVKGFSYVGAFEVLDSLGILGTVQRVGGSSVGAIQALLLATGYTTEEMKTIAAGIPLKTFNDGFILGGFHRMKTKLGFFKGNAVGAWIDTLIKRKTGDADITFREFHEQKEAKHYKDLYITGTDLTYQCLRIFSYETYPDMKIKDAVRITMSVPLYFQPVYINDAGSVVKRTDTGHVHIMVDGGLASNYPVTMFDDERYGDCVSMGGKKQNRQTLGLILEKPEQIAYSKEHKGNYPLPVITIRNYMGAVYHTIIDKPNPELTDNHSLHRTIMISNLNISGRVRKIPKATVDRFVQSGREGARAFFAEKKPVPVSY